MMAICNGISECVGHTPLVRLRRIATGPAEVVAKIENMNPLWSVKDRIAAAMIDAAELDGLIGPQTVIIEPTGGNAGIGLAFVCAERGYKLVVTMPESMSLERRRMLKALGAELVLTPADEGMSGAVRRAEEMLQANRHYYMPQHFKHPANPQVHRETTAERDLARYPGGAWISLSPAWAPARNNHRRGPKFSNLANPRCKSWRSSRPTAR